MADYRSQILKAFENDEIDEEDARGLFKKYSATTAPAPVAPQPDIAEKIRRQYVYTPTTSEPGKVEAFKTAAEKVPWVQKLAIPALQAPAALASGILDLTNAAKEYAGLPVDEDYQAERAVIKDKAAQNTTPEYTKMAEKLGELPTEQGLAQRALNPTIAAGEIAGQYPLLAASTLTMGAAAPAMKALEPIKGAAGTIARGAARYGLGSLGAAPVAAPLEAGAAVDEAQRRGVKADPGDVLASTMTALSLEGASDVMMPSTWKAVGGLFRGGKDLAADQAAEAAKLTAKRLAERGISKSAVGQYLKVAAKTLGEMGLSSAGNGFEEWAQTIAEEAPANIAENKSVFQPETLERARQAVAPGVAMGFGLGGAGAVREGARSVQDIQGQRIYNRTELIQQAQAAGVPLVDAKGKARPAAEVQAEITSKAQSQPGGGLPPTQPEKVASSPTPPATGAGETASSRLGELYQAADQQQEGGGKTNGEVQADADANEGRQEGLQVAQPEVPAAPVSGESPAGGAAIAAPPQTEKYSVKAAEQPAAMARTTEVAASQQTEGTAPEAPPVAEPAPDEPSPLYEQRVQAAEEQARRPDVTEEMVRRALPAAERYEPMPDNGGYIAHLPGDRQIWVKPSGEIFFDKSRARAAGYSEAAIEGGKPAASWSKNQRDAIIQLTEQGLGEIDHEVYHDAREFALTEAQKATAAQTYGDEEAEARGYNAWKNDPARKPDSIFETIKDWAQTLLDATAGRESLRGTFRSVETGKAYREAGKRAEAMPDRLPGEKPAEEKYALTPKEAEAKTPEGGPKYAQNESHDAWRVNLSTIPESEREFVRGIVENEPFDQYASSWQTRPQAEVLRIAEKQLRDSDHVKDLLKRSPTGRVSDQVLAELGTLYASAALEIREAHEVAHDSPTPANQARLMAAQVRYNALHARYFGAGAEAGRALAIMRNMKSAMRKNNPFEAVKGAMEDRGVSVSQDELNALLAIPPGDTRAFLQWQEGVLRSRQSTALKLKNWLTTYRMFNMLFNTATQSANLVSNGIKTAIDLPVDLTEAMFSKDKTMGDVLTYYAALLRSLPIATTSAAQTLTRGVSDFELARGLYSGAAGEQAASELAGGGKNPLNWGLRVTRAGDVAFRDAHYLAATQMLATRAAIAKGLSGQALADEIEAQKLSGLHHEEATQIADEKTFQEGGKRLRKTISFANSMPGLRWVLPFIKTPYNINAAGLRLLPGVGIGAAMMQKQKGSRIVGEQIVGLGLTLGMGYAMAAVGRATGGAPDDEGERDKFFNAERKEAYSVKIGNQWVRYSRLGIISLPIVLGVAMREYEERGAEDKNAGAAFGKLLGKVGKMISDQSMLMGINGLSKAIAEPDKYGETFLKNILGQLVPAASLQRGITRAIEDEILEPGGTVDKLLADLPKPERNFMLGLLKKSPIPQKYDSLGRPQTYRGGGPQALIGWIKGAETVDDPVVQELIDLGVDYPTAVGKTITEEITVEQQQAKSQRLGRDLMKSEMKQRGEIRRDDLSAKRQTVGGAVYAEAKRVMNAPWYKGMSKVRKAEALTKAIGKVKTKTAKKWNAEFNDGQ